MSETMIAHEHAGFIAIALSAVGIPEDRRELSDFLAGLRYSDFEFDRGGSLRYVGKSPAWVKEPATV